MRINTSNTICDNDYSSRNCASLQFLLWSLLQQRALGESLRNSCHGRCLSMNFIEIILRRILICFSACAACRLTYRFCRCSLSIKSQSNTTVIEAAHTLLSTYFSFCKLFFSCMTIACTIIFLFIFPLLSYSKRFHTSSEKSM